MIFNKLMKSKEEVFELIRNFDNTIENQLITYFNQHCFNIFHTEPEYKKIIKNNFHTYPDGIGIYLALKIFNYQKVEIFNASDLNEEILQILINQKRRIFLVGGNFSEIQISSKKGNGLNICGYQSGYFLKQEENEIINKIKRKNPEVIFIAMGVPKQEFFAVELAEKLENKIIICTGNFFEFYFGNIKRIPKGFRNLGIEWLFRLFSEPKRLWKRYILGIPFFFFLILKEFFNHTFSRS